MNPLYRNVISWINELLSNSPIVVIEGARQVGKSTLTSMLEISNASYRTMDDELHRSFASDDPHGFLNSAGDHCLIIDEIQRCPELIVPLKAEVDKDRRPSRFILTGSANLLRIPGAEDSLAGRALTTRLHPFSQDELAQRRTDWVTAIISGSVPVTSSCTRDDVIHRATIGGYPLVQDLTEKMRMAWLRDYAKRLTERDSKDIADVSRPILLKLLKLVAAAPGSELVLERLGQELGVNRITAGRYLDILEAMFLVYQLPAWSRNLTKRQTNRPKCYLSDSGLAAALSGQHEQHLRTLEGADHLGPILENFVVCELLRQQGWSATDYSLSYLRDRNGMEVDLIIETPAGIIAVEIKAATAATASHFKHLTTLREKLGAEFLAGIVLTTERGAQAGDRMYSVPVSSLWQS